MALEPRRRTADIDLEEEELIHNDLSEPLLESTVSSASSTSTLSSAPLTHNESDVNARDSDPPQSAETESSVEAAAAADQQPNNKNPWKNHNVVLSLVLCVVSGVADSIWGSVVLSGYLLALAQAMGERAEGNTLVGSAEAVQGLTQLVTALPVGILADQWGKDKTVRLGGFLMLITISIHLWTLVDVEHNAEDSTTAATRSYIIMVVTLGLWGIVEGISMGPSQALFSDSIPTGRRSEMLTWLYSCYLMSSAIGPIVSIIMFSTERDADDWSLSELFPVFVVGVALEIPVAVIMFFFSDKHRVPEIADSSRLLEQRDPPHDEEHREVIVPQSETETLLLNDGNNDESPSETSETCPEERPAGDTSMGVLLLTRNHADAHPMKALIPYVLFVSSLIVSLASGASVKYFPLFFKELGFGSATVQGIFLVVPIFIAAFTFVAQKMGKRLGRIEATFITSTVGVILLYYMTWLSHDASGTNTNGGNAWSIVADSGNGDDADSLWQRDPHRAMLIVAVYLVRTGAMNCSYPLLESILMDNVPSNQRARWKALESIASFGWTGSALAGGILSDRHSYQFTFAITATMQLVGGLLLLLIRPFVEAEDCP